MNYAALGIPEVLGSLILEFVTDFTALFFFFSESTDCILNFKRTKLNAISPPRINKNVAMV